jgi:large subunit ribosomal protein L19e
MAAELLGIGKSRVKVDPDATEQLQDAITRESIRGWLSAGLIWREPARGNSRGRLRARRKKGKLRGKGQGSKKGAKGARVGKKSVWVAQVRMLRKKLRVARDRGRISGQQFRVLYPQIKGGQITTRKRLEEAIGSS